ncbi:MAG: sigma 54-interacting transcriptional regulator [Isosphaeraceae bacterium]|nr:sigma 54-interacting transcriptional regulator [Isosphaeraceae bacterium]
MASSRVPGARLESLWQQAREPVFLLSPECKLLLVNPAWEELTGYSAEQVIGLICRAHGPTKPGELGGVAGSFHPPSEALGGTPSGGPTLIVHASGERRWRRVEFWPFHNEHGELMVLFGMVRPPEAQPAVPDADSERLRHELLEVRHRLWERHRFDELIGAGPMHGRLLEQVRAAAATTVPILIVGEPGTGKHAVARSIHLRGAAPDAPLIPFDCEALPSELLERDLFGGGPGSTDPALPFPEGATLLLSHVFHLPRDLQVRLAASLGAPIRVIATSIQPPDDALRAERVHPNLFFALTALVIRLHPLRERVAEIPLFAQHFLERANQRGLRQQKGLTPEAVSDLEGYDWPGNLREMSRVVAEAHEKGRGDSIGVDDLPAMVRGHLGAAYNPPPLPGALTPLDDLLTQVERRLIEYALQRARHNKSKAADILGISRPRLYRRIKELGLPDENEPVEEPASANGSRT